MSSSHVHRPISIGRIGRMDFHWYFGFSRLINLSGGKTISASIINRSCRETHKGALLVFIDHECQIGWQNANTGRSVRHWYAQINYRQHHPHQHLTRLAHL